MNIIPLGMRAVNRWPLARALDWFLISRHRGGLGRLPVARGRPAPSGPTVGRQQVGSSLISGRWDGEGVAEAVKLSLGATGRQFSFRSARAPAGEASPRTRPATCGRLSPFSCQFHGAPLPDREPINKWLGKRRRRRRRRPRASRARPDPAARISLGAGHLLRGRKSTNE